MAQIVGRQMAVLSKERQVVTETHWVGHGHTRLSKAASYAAMALCVFVVGIPAYWMLIGSFKPMAEIYAMPPTWLPLAPTLRNYREAWSSAPFGRYYINTIITTAFGSGFEMFFGITSAYCFAFLWFPHKNVLFMVLLAALMIPGQIVVLPNFVTMGALGWINTYQGIIIPGASVAYGTFLLRQYYLTLPAAILDAAKVDGATHLRTLWSVVIPIAKPAIVTSALISVVNKWNDFMWPLLITNTREMRVLPIGIYWLRVEEGQIDWGVVMAGTMFVVAPVVLGFLWAQRYIIDGIASGAVKG